MLSLDRRGESRIPNPISLVAYWDTVKGMNMSDIKNPTPFYTLKDAAKELNRILDVDYYDTKKLLNMALAYELQLYIFVKGWKGQVSYAEEMTEEWNEYADVDKHGGYTKLHFDMDATLEAIINARLNLFFNEGCLLEVQQELMKILIINKKFIGDSSFAYFGNILDIQDSFIGNPKNYFLEVFKQRPSSYLLRELEECMPDVIASVVDIKIAWTELLHEGPSLYHGAIIPSPVVDNTIEKDGQPAIYQAINRTDLLITHYQLSKIIDGSLTLRGRQVETIETLIGKQDLKPRGKSKARENAKFAAKTLAHYLWSKDTDNKIKIKEMAINVYAELSQTEHHVELPDQAVSLKEWIKEVAPAYAKEAGRPKRNI